MTMTINQIEEKAYKAAAEWQKFVAEIESLYETNKQAWGEALDQRRATAPGYATYGDLSVSFKTAQGRTTWMRAHLRKIYRLGNKVITREKAMTYLATHPSEKDG